MKENKEIKITSENLNAAYAVADESMRKVLDALVGRAGETTAPKPTLSDYTTIRSYEDACVALGERVDEESLKSAGVPAHIIALMKLELVCKALWGGEVKVYPEPDGSRVYWYPWFVLFNKKELDDMTSEQRGGLLSAVAYGGSHAGFGCLYASYRSSDALAYSGFRLCLDTGEKALYFGKQFLKLWAEYIAFNFTVGEPIIE